MLPVDLSKGSDRAGCLLLLQQLTAPACLPYLHQVLLRRPLCLVVKDAHEEPRPVPCLPQLVHLGEQSAINNQPPPARVRPPLLLLLPDLCC